MAINSFIILVLKLKIGVNNTSLKAPSFFPLNKSTPSIPKGKSKVSWSPLGIFNGAVALRTSGVYSSYLELLSRMPTGMLHKV